MSESTPFHTYERIIAIRLRHNVFADGGETIDAFVDSDINNRCEVIGHLWRIQQFIHEGGGCFTWEPGEIKVTVPETEEMAGEGGTQ